MNNANQHIKQAILSRFKVKEEDLKKLCRKMGVRSLAVFGSVVSQDSFKVGQSDIDFLVEFDNISADKFFDFIEELKNLFHYEYIDLVTKASLKNQVIKESILSSQENIYAA